MEDRFAIKRADAWLWQSNLTRADVLSRLEERVIDRDWLVCPQGSSDRAITIGQLVDDPAVFERKNQADAAHEEHRRAIVASVEKPPLLKLGKKILQLFCGCLVIGGAVVKIFFPHMVGAGLTPATLTILVPVWSIGIAGLLAALLGWIQFKYRVRTTLKMAELTEADKIWNRACGEDPLRVLPGDRALAGLLYAHGLTMNGGVLHAVECMTVEELFEAEAGYRYFGLVGVASLLSRARQSFEEEEALGNLEPTLNSDYARMIPSDSSLVERFEDRLRSSPWDFAPVRAKDVD